MPFTEEEYERFKKEAAEKRKNRLYVVWRNVARDLDCRVVGPSSACFCGHRYRAHATDNTADRNVHCQVAGCRCQLYEYVPVRGTQDVKCHCKHSYEEHRVNGKRRCRRAGCACAGFASSISCSCGDRHDAHVTVFETREERIAGGRRVDNLGGGGGGGAPVAAMGGLTCFSDLVDGIERLGGGGCGRPPLKEGPAERPPPGALARIKGVRPAASKRRGSGASADNSDSSDERRALEERLADPSVSQAKRYALKKQLAVLKARLLREERRRKQQQQQ